MCNHRILVAALVIAAVGSGAWCADAMIIPMSRSLVMREPGAPNRPAAVEISSVRARVSILEQTAETTLEVSFRNPNNFRQEAQVLLPVPEGAVIRSFAFEGNSSVGNAELMPKEEARKLYESIIAKTRDPALLEFAGYSFVRSSVFPLEPLGAQTVRFTYENVLIADGSRVDYVLPRSEAAEYNVPWDIEVKIQSKQPIAMLYSPSHDIESTRASANTLTARVAEQSRREPGSFHLSYVTSNDPAAASLFAYPDPKGDGGYFLLLAGVPRPEHAQGNEVRMKRELTLVLDRSGSMNGEKIEQVREAALEIVAGLDDGESFNIIDFSDSVGHFSKEPVIKSQATSDAARAYIKHIRAMGGTDIYGALSEALRPKPAEGFLPLVLFLTDGMPTVGQTSETAIRDLSVKANPYDRRIFTFGVGLDVNTPLLDRLASLTRATTTIVLPKENVEVKVGAVFKHLTGPVLARGAIEAVDDSGNPAPGRVTDMLPSRIPDLFDGDQLVLLGRYIGQQPLNFRLTGNYMGQAHTFAFNFALDKATAHNAFVPRLWASRKIGVLIDAIRDLGADKTGAAVNNDPRAKELTDDIVRLSKEFGILTEYTAFLATEGTDLSRRDQLDAIAQTNFINRAVNVRSGSPSWNQESNKQAQREQQHLNHGNVQLDENLNRVSVTGVQQVGDLTFYRRGDRWVDARVENAKAAPAQVIEYGSDEFKKLSNRLAKEGREATFSMKGEIMLNVDGKTVLCK